MGLTKPVCKNGRLRFLQTVYSIGLVREAPLELLRSSRLYLLKGQVGKNLCLAEQK